MIGIFCGSVVQKMNLTCSGGSSSVFSRALKAAVREHVHFVDDVDLVPRAARTHVGVRPQLADLVDAAVAGAVDLDHIHVFPGINRLADVAVVVRVRRRAVRRIECLGEDAGRGRLADPARAGEQIGMPDAIRVDRVDQGLGHLLLADQVLERLGTIAARDHDVRVGPGGGLIRRLGRPRRRRIV